MIITNRYNLCRGIFIILLVMGLQYLAYSIIEKESRPDNSECNERWSESENERYLLYRRYDADLKRFLDLAAEYYDLQGQCYDLEEMLGKCGDRWEACLINDWR